MFVTCDNMYELVLGVSCNLSKDGFILGLWVESELQENMNTIFSADSFVSGESDLT